MSSLYLLWDEAYIWGLLACNAMNYMGIPYRLVKADEISGGLLKKNPPAAFMAPGGSARAKAAALGPQGLENIRAYVRSGGHYLGFCGGAGLGLSAAAGPGAGPGVEPGLCLGLCPWRRGVYEDRLQHFMSGHISVHLPTPAAGKEALSPPPGLPSLLPVWWPGRFLPEKDARVRVLATYGGPGPDFWLADLPISALPADAFSTWHDLYGLNLSPVFLAGQPCLIHGEYGEGDYILSYSHLETPASPFANAWLKGILSGLCGLSARPGTSTPAPGLWQDPAQEALITEWDLGVLRLAELGEAEFAGTELAGTELGEAELARSLHLLRGVLAAGLKHGLLFKRSSWLLGWRSGLPGAALNNLHAALASLAVATGTAGRAGQGLKPAAQAFWQKQGASFTRNMEFFAEGVTNYLLAERLSMTLSKDLPGTVSPQLLKAQRQNLFGRPMQPGGLYHELMRVADELAYLQLNTER